MKMDYASLTNKSDEICEEYIVVWNHISKSNEEWDSKKIRRLLWFEVVHFQSWIGELWLFERLFGEHLRPNNREAIFKLMDDFRASLKRFIANHRPESEYIRAIERQLNDACDHYMRLLGEVKHGVTEVPKRIGLLYDLNGNPDELLTRRHEFESCFNGIKLTDTKADIHAVEDRIRSNDCQLVEVMRLYNELSIESTGIMDIEDEKALVSFRFSYPPEIFPWGWAWLELKEGRPLHEIFGFDPEEVKRKLDEIGHRGGGSR